MTYTQKQQRIAAQLARQLQRIAKVAGDNELYMGNGGDIGSMLGGIVGELESIATKTARLDLRDSFPQPSGKIPRITDAKRVNVLKLKIKGGQI